MSASKLVNQNIVDLILGCRQLLAANVDGLLLCWYFITVSSATEAD
jgi:hypothetical protein